MKDTERQKPGEHWQEKRSHDVTVTPKLTNIGISKNLKIQTNKVDDVTDLNNEEKNNDDEELLCEQCKMKTFFKKMHISP